MNTKQYLSQAVRLNQIINSKLEDLESLRSLAESATSNIRSDKVSVSGVTQAMAEAAVSIVDLSREINAEIDMLVDLKREIHGLIRQVEDWDCRLLLEMRYINGKSWDEIAEQWNYSTRGILKIHGRALKEVADIRQSFTLVP